jgi:hypothetical protein
MTGTEKITVTAYKDSSKISGLYRAADGSYFVTYPVMVFPFESTVRKIEAAVADYMDQVRGYFFRCTMDASEDQHIPARSYNHRDGHYEKGLSVAEHPGYFFATDYTYIYVVSGKVVGFGSDGEPLLTNVKALSAPATGLTAEWVTRYKADMARKPFDADTVASQIDARGDAPDGDLVIAF